MSNMKFTLRALISGRMCLAMSQPIVNINGDMSMPTPSNVNITDLNIRLLALPGLSVTPLNISDERSNALRSGRLEFTRGSERSVYTLLRASSSFTMLAMSPSLSNLLRYSDNVERDLPMMYDSSVGVKSPSWRAWRILLSTPLVTFTTPSAAAYSS